MVRIPLLKKYFLCGAWNAILQTLVQDAEIELAYSLLDPQNHAIVKTVVQTNWNKRAETNWFFFNFLFYSYIEAVQAEYPNATDHEVAVVVSNYFRYAPAEVRRKAKR